jgi:ankyrin repeat protein
LEETVWTALESGDSEKARSFFLGEVDVHAVDSRGRTPLHIAAEKRDSQLGAFFISMGADVNALDNEGRRPLDISAGLGDASLAAHLVKAGADIHYPAQGADPAARDSPALSGISRKGDLLNALLTADSLRSLDSEGRTILHLAAMKGDPEAVQQILTAPAFSAAELLEARDKMGRTALDLVLSRLDSRDHAAAAETLILAGSQSLDPVYSYFAPAVRSSNFNIRLYDGRTPLHFAAREGHLGLLSFFIERNAQINIKDASGSTALHEAARVGNIKAMELLLSQGADPNAQDAKGNSALHLGIPPESHREAIGLLLNYRVNSNLRDEHGDSPLHIVVTLNRKSNIVQALLSGGTDVSIRNIDGKTALYLAVEEGRMELIPPLLSYQSDVFAADNGGITPFERALEIGNPVLSALITTETVFQTDSAGNTILHKAIENYADIKTVSFILEQQAMINARNREGNTSLHLAASLNEAETGELLISRGADIFAPNARGETPLYMAFLSPGGVRRWMINSHTVLTKDGLGNGILHYAAQWKIDAQIPYIVQQGADLEAKNATGETPLFVAAKSTGERGSPQDATIKTLISAGASLTSRDNLGNSILHAAVRWNNRESAQTLINLGIDINARALNGKTPLHDAVRLGISDIETLLINQGADIEIRDTGGNTPFMEAVGAGNVNSAERLVNFGADSNTRNNLGDTPLHLAVSSGQNNMVNLLLLWGAPIHARNSQGRSPYETALFVSPGMVSTLLTKDRIQMADDNGASPLHIAIREGAPLSLIRVIIDQGARLSPVDSGGRSPLRLAVDQEYWELAKILADAGADPFTIAGDGKTPGELVIMKGPGPIRAVFSGKAIGARDSSGNTILHYAARIGNAETISMLLQLGANKSIRNVSSESPADIARRWARMDTLSMLN